GPPEIRARQARCHGPARVPAVPVFRIGLLVLPHLHSELQGLQLGSDARRMGQAAARRSIPVGVAAADPGQSLRHLRAEWPLPPVVRRNVRGDPLANGRLEAAAAEDAVLPDVRALVGAAGEYRRDLPVLLWTRLLRSHHGLA